MVNAATLNSGREFGNLGNVADEWQPPAVADPERVGTYPALSKAGGGLVWDAVLEYRVWCHPEAGTANGSEGDDSYLAFSSYEAALEFARATLGAEEPLALVLQEEYIEETAEGEYIHRGDQRITEWPVEFLRRPRRTPRTIPDFLASDAPTNRLDILRGLA